MNKVLVRSAEYVIGFTLAIVCSQSGINEIGNNAPLANNKGRLTRFATAINVSHFLILKAIAVNKHANPVANINNETNTSTTIVILSLASTNPPGINDAMMNTSEH